MDTEYGLINVIKQDHENIILMQKLKNICRGPYSEANNLELL